MTYDFKRPKDAYREAAKYNRAGKPAPFPPYVTFQLNNSCNFRCRMCALSYLDQDEGFMEGETFHAALDQVAEQGSLVRFIGWNENFLYPDLLDAIRAVKEKRLLLHITTNGSLISREAAETIIEVGVDSIIFSFQGLTREEDMFMRRIGEKVYDRIIDNIKMMYRLKAGGKPKIKITTTISHRDDPQARSAFEAEHSQYADEVQVTGFTHLGHIEEAVKPENVWEMFGLAEPKLLGDVVCHLPNFEMLIKPEGSVALCCGGLSDSLVVGNVNEDRLSDIWHSEAAGRIRAALAAGRLDDYSDCAVCGIRYDYQGLPNTMSSFQKVDQESD